MAEHISDRFKRVREDKNLSQEEMAHSLGIKQGSISKIENGTNKPSTTLIKLFCLIYNINEQWLMTGKGEIYATQNDQQPYRLIKTSHEDLVSKFENKELAEDINQRLLELESIDGSQLLVVKGVIEGLCLALRPDKKLGSA